MQEIRDYRLRLRSNQASDNDLFVFYCPYSLFICVKYISLRIPSTLNLKMSQNENNNKFDIKVVSDNFEAALYEDDDVHLLYYLDSFEELNKFFTLMGTIFGFVSKDLRAKMDLLSELIKSNDNGEQFTTAKKMIEYEKQNDLLYKKGYTSGTRTLLRIHRGLDFIKLFLKKLYDLKNEESSSNACKEAYEQTLAKHHSFVIRNGAKIAIYALPTKEILLSRVCGEPEHVQRAMELLPKTLEISSNIFSRIDRLYTANDLHQLP